MVLKQRWTMEAYFFLGHKAYFPQRDGLKKEIHYLDDGNLSFTRVNYMGSLWSGQLCCFKHHFFFSPTELSMLSEERWTGTNSVANSWLTASFLHFFSNCVICLSVKLIYQRRGEKWIQKAKARSNWVEEMAKAMQWDKNEAQITCHLWYSRKPHLDESNQSDSLTLM